MFRVQENINMTICLEYKHLKNIINTKLTEFEITIYNLHYHPCPITLRVNLIGVRRRNPCVMHSTKFGKQS